jgi:hypothetical protein
VTQTPAYVVEHRAIEAYVADLDRDLRGPRRMKRDILTEARDSLVDATAAYQKAGLDPRDAERRAVAEFGDVAEIAPGYQTELALAQSRRTAWVVIATLVLQTVVWDNLLPAVFSDRPVVGGSLAESVDTSLEWLGGVLWAAAFTVLIVSGIGSRYLHPGARLVRTTGMFGLVVCGILALGGGLMTALSPATSQTPWLETAGPLLVFLALPIVCIVRSSRRCFAVAPPPAAQ